MMGKIRGVTMALAIATLALAASVSTHAQAQAPGQPAAAPQTQPATPPAPTQPKAITTNLGRDFARVKPMWPEPDRAVHVGAHSGSAVS